MILNLIARASEYFGTHQRRANWLYCSIAAAAVLLSASSGVGLDVDSTGYLGAGINLAHGRGLVGVGNTTFTLFAPALPAFISIGVRLGLSAQTTDLIINVLSAILTVLLGRTLLLGHVSRPHLVTAGSILIALGWPLLQVTSLALTEPLTVVVVLLLVLALERYGTTSRPVASLAILALLLNVGFFLRYAGLAFLPACALVVLVERRSTDSLLRRILAVSVLVASSLVGPVLWMLRNRSVDGSLLGPRYPSVVGVAAVAKQYAQALAKLILPGPTFFEYLLFGTVLIALAIALRRLSREGDQGPRGLVRRLAPWAVLLYVCSSYALYLYAAELSTKIDPVDSRLLVPIYVPCVVLVIAFLDTVMSPGVIVRGWDRLVTWSLVLLLSVQVLISCALVVDFAVNGRDFNSSAWRSSALVDAAKATQTKFPIFTNSVPGLWAALGRNDIQQLPLSLADARRLLSCPGVEIVYFSQAAGSYFGSAGDVTAQTSAVALNVLKSNFPLRVVFSNEQGEILRITKGNNGPGCQA